MYLVFRFYKNGVRAHLDMDGLHFPSCFSRSVQNRVRKYVYAGSFSFYISQQDLAVVVLLILIPLISPNSSKGGVSSSLGFLFPSVRFTFVFNKAMCWQ